MRIPTLLILALATSTTQAALLPGNAANGKALNDKYCTACHDSKMYTRPDHKIKTVEGLIGRVKGCVQQTGAKLDSNQIDDLTKYLDESFYKFK